MNFNQCAYILISSHSLHGLSGIKHTVVYLVTQEASVPQYELGIKKIKKFKTSTKSKENKLKNVTEKGPIANCKK